MAGLNIFTLTGTDRAGNTHSQVVNVTRGCSNLVPDPGFESGVSGFAAQDASSQVVQTGVSPLDGAHSLRVAINGYGNNVWWAHPFAGGTASHFGVSAHLRSDVASSSILQFCAMVYYADDTTALHCTAVSGAAGDKGVVSAELTLDPAKPLASVRIRLIQEGSDAVQFTLDDAMACLDVVAGPTGGGGGGGRWRWRRWRWKLPDAFARPRRVSRLHLRAAHGASVHLAERLRGGRSGVHAVPRDSRRRRTRPSAAILRTRIRRRTRCSCSG